MLVPRTFQSFLFDVPRVRIQGLIGIVGGKDCLRKRLVSALLEPLEIDREAEKVLGRQAWRLVRGSGRLIGGPLTGLYVSGAPLDAQREIVRRLVAGETVSVHLMHTHRSRHFEPSSLRWERGGLIVVYEDREVRV